MTARSNSSFLATLRADLAARAAARRDRQALAYEISQYRTDSERAELEAILDRSRSEDSEPIRRLHSVMMASAGSARR